MCPYLLQRESYRLYLTPTVLGSAVVSHIESQLRFGPNGFTVGPIYSSSYPQVRSNFFSSLFSLTPTPTPLSLSSHAHAVTIAWPRVAGL